MPRVRNRIIVTILVGTVLILSMLVALSRDWFHTSETDSYTIDLKYESTDEPGLPDQITGMAPPGMELAAYLNHHILAVTEANALGKYSIIVPILAQRRNEIAVLPTQIDSSTLPLLYDPSGFQTLYIPPAHIQVKEPFLAATWREADEVHVYGSAAPLSQMTIFAEACQSDSPANTTTSDDEGSFHGILPIPRTKPLPSRYCLRLTPEAEPGEDFLVNAPDQSVLQEGDLWTRSVAAEFTPTDVRLIFSVKMPDGYLVYRNLAEGNLSEMQFIEYIFGNVTLNTYLDPRLLSWRQEKASGSHLVRVLVESPPLSFLIPEDTATTFQLDTSDLQPSIPPFGKNDTVTVNLKNVRVLESRPPPDVSLDSQQVWQGDLANTHGLTLWVSRNDQPLADPVGYTRLRGDISELISGLQIQLPWLLRDTLEGEIVGLLPAHLPGPVQAQVYDIYRASYQKDPFLGGQADKPTFQTFLRDLPAHLPHWLASLLFSAIWLIPAVLTLWALWPIALESPLRADLGRLAAGSLILGQLTLDWSPLLATAGQDGTKYIHWIAAALLMFIVLFLPIPRWTNWLFTRPMALFIFSVLSVPFATWIASFLLYTLPDGWATALLTSLALLGLAMLAWHASQIGRAAPRAPSPGLVLIVIALLFGISLPVQSLPLSAQLTGMFGVSSLGVTVIRPLVTLPLLLGIAMALRYCFDRPIGTVLDPIARRLGRVLLVGFVIGLSPAWGFIPVASAIGLILFEWLLPPALLPSHKVASHFVKQHHQEGIRQLLHLNRQTRLWRAAEASTRKLVREGKMEDKEYHDLREEYEKSARELEQPDYVGGMESKLSLRDLAFNFGAGPRHRDNLRHAIAWGLILVVPLILIQGWPLAFAKIEASLPLPFLDTGIRLVVLSSQYLASAIFLGYFFPDLRGRNGMEKGGWLAAAVVIAFLPYHLLYASTAPDWIAMVIWAGSVMAFDLLVGLLAFDIRTLTDFKLGWIRLPDLYDFGSLAIYLTGSGTPLITTGFTALFGKLDELIPALLKVVFPSLTLSGAQFELFQMLLDLANRITTGVMD